MQVNDKVKLSGTVLKVNNYELDTKAVIQLEDGQYVEISTSIVEAEIPVAPETEEPVEP